MLLSLFDQIFRVSLINVFLIDFFNIFRIMLILFLSTICFLVIYFVVLDFEDVFEFFIISSILPSKKSNFFLIFNIFFFLFSDINAINKI